MSKKSSTNSASRNDKSDDLSHTESVSSLNSHQSQSEPSQTSEINPLQDVLQFEYPFYFIECIILNW